MDPAWAAHYRYSTSAKLRDVLYGVAVGTAPGFVVWYPFKEDVDGFGCFHVFASWAFFTMLAVVVLALVRWGRVARIDSLGVAVQASWRGPSIELTWEAIDEVFPLSHGGVEVRGDGRALRLDWTLGGQDFRAGVAERCRERLQGGILERLRGGKTVDFPGVWNRGRGLAAAALSSLFLASPIAVFLRLAAGNDQEAGCGVLFLLILIPLSISAVRLMLWRGARVEASVGGLRLLWLWERPFFRWSEIVRIDEMPDGSARLVLGKGAESRLQPTLANLFALPWLHARLKSPST